MNETNQAPAMRPMRQLTRSEWRIDAKPEVPTLRSAVHSQYCDESCKNQNRTIGESRTLRGAYQGLGEIRLGRKGTAPAGESGSIAAAGVI